MFLYELAIALDRRSPELTEAGAELGLGDLQPATDLDAHQVAALRAHFSGGMQPPPLAPRGSGATSPLPAAPTGPLSAEPLVFGAPPPQAASPGAAPGGPGVPVAPASWGPPTAPANWGPPPGALPAPPPPPAPSGEVAHTGPHFAYPESAAAPIAADSPTGFGDAALPAPPPPGSPSPAPGSGAMGPGQKVLIGGAVVAVIALFGFMLANTGPDESRQQAIAAKEAAIEAELATTAPAPTTTVTPTTTAVPPPSVDEPVDLERFCRGGLAIATFELRLAAAIADEDFAELSGLVRDRRAAWGDDVATMASGAAPALVHDIERYRGGYDEFFDVIASSSTLDEVYTELDHSALTESTDAAREVGAQITVECE